MQLRSEGSSPASHLGRLHIKVGSQDVDVGIQAEGPGGLSLPCLPHLKTGKRVVWVGIVRFLALRPVAYLLLNSTRF